MDPLSEAAGRIIEEQEKIVGPIALEQAQKVQGLSVDWTKHEVKIVGSEKDVLENLVKKYESLFGKASIEVCKEAIYSMAGKISQNDLPEVLTR